MGENDNPIKLYDQHLTVAPKTDITWFETFGNELAGMWRGVFWWIGDLAIAMERQHRSAQQQAWPVWISPGMISRCKAVAEAYPPEDRHPGATWTTHMNLANRGDRVAAVAATVEAGQTSDEVRKNPPPPLIEHREEEPAKLEMVKVEEPVVKLDEPQAELIIRNAGFWPWTRAITSTAISTLGPAWNPLRRSCDGSPD